MADTDLPDSAIKRIKEILVKANNDVDSLIQKYQQNNLEAFPGRTIVETLELKILEILNKARNETGIIVNEHIDRSKPTIIMVNSGSRGNPLNLAQMSACVGQQALRGRRIDVGYTHRTLSHFKKNELSPTAKGFIYNSFKSGLSPSEFFFGAMTGRDSLMDTALRTPKSGYLYRRLANALQDLRVEYDHTVRDASGKVIQFEYGEDSIDVSRSENGILNVKKIIQMVEQED